MTPDHSASIDGERIFPGVNHIYSRLCPSQVDRNTGKSLSKPTIETFHAAAEELDRQTRILKSPSILEDCADFAMRKEHLPEALIIAGVLLQHQHELPGAVEAGNALLARVQRQLELEGDEWPKPVAEAMRAYATFLQKTPPGSPPRSSAS